MDFYFFLVTGPNLTFALKSEKFSGPQLTLIGPVEVYSAVGRNACEGTDPRMG